MKDRKKQWRMLINFMKVDFCRAFFSRRFLLAVLLIPAADMVSAASDTTYYGMNVFQKLEMIDGFGLCFFVYAIYTIPYAYSYCADLTNRFISYSFIRGRRDIYVRSKIIACAVSGGCAAFFGRFLTIILLSFRMPLYGSVFYSSADFFMVILFEALQAAFFSAMAFMVSVWIPNIFIIAAAPMIGHSFLVNFISLFTFHPMLSLERIYSFPGGVFENVGINFLYAVFFTVLMICVMEKISRTLMIRRLYNE